MIKEAYPRNAYKLINVDGDELGHFGMVYIWKDFTLRESRINTVLNLLDDKTERL